MENIEKIKMFMDFLIRKNIVENQAEFGKSLGYDNKSSFSQMLKREPSEKFIIKINEIYPDFKDFNENKFVYNQNDCELSILKERLLFYKEKIDFYKEKIEKLEQENRILKKIEKQNIPNSPMVNAKQ